MRFPMAGASLLDHFSALEDPRQAWKVGYPLPEILLVVLCGTIAGAENFVEIERWANRKLAFLRRLRPFGRGVPSHDTLNDVMNALPARLFSECFTAWVESLRKGGPDIVAIDGKTSRRARAGTAHPLHLVSAWASRQRLVLGQEAVASKGNEITAIPLLLERLELTGALVTIDAIGCQRDIAQAIRAKGADYLLALKENWPTLAEDVRLFFETAPTSAFDTHQTVDGDHGRIETRRHRVSREVGWLTTSRRFPGEPRFPDLAAIASVEAEVERNGKTTTARRFYLSSAPLDAKLFARAVRAHWGIENQLHWVMDVVFHDDLMRLRTEHGPGNMATIKHAALNLIREIPDKASLAVRRKTAAWDDDYLLAALTRPAH
jgi:predicted transposase YbfD/YdcC